MSTGACDIRCTHGKGLACPICYDQTYGANWSPEKEVVYQELKALAEKVIPYRHPFLNTDHHE